MGIEAQVIWTKQALLILRGIFDFYETKSMKAAEDLSFRIYLSSDILKTFPQAGMMEPLLEYSPRPYRSLIVEKNYKLIYFIEGETVNIDAVWDMRQSPSKLKRLIKK